MRILIVTGIFPPDIGGPATYVPQIARGLSERGHQVKVLTTSEPKYLSKDNVQYPFSVFRMNRRTSLSYRPLLYVQQILRHGQEVDLIFSNGVFLETALANLRLRKPLVTKVVGDEAWERATRKGWTHDGFEDFQSRRQPLYGETLKCLRSWEVKQADKVIVPSHYLTKWVIQWGVLEQRLAVIYNAVPPIDGIGPIEVPLKTPVKVVTVSRLVPWKRIDGIIRAIGGCENAGLIVVGDGPQRSLLEGLARKLKIAERIYFAGEQARKETLSIMAASDVFVLNSTYEGLPHVVLEAMSLGLPVVATAVGGAPEIICNGYNGILVEISDDNLKTGLNHLLNDRPFRMSLASNARVTAKEFSNSSNMIEQTETVLLKVAGEQN